jgi:hypothetical protein
MAILTFPELIQKLAVRSPLNVTAPARLDRATDDIEALAPLVRGRW